ncbi:cell division protein FtsQ/DivIB [Sphingomonas jatrophae]|uniref:Cell division protein FtsQ n=1 Tax=Sphingomonas jatrophae TaxID=1166337 RepID=A0A1I6M6F7_9SPHN|nr:FtsQ-type POTRA domain-containing protein [Sphingomonas jatrophae]SFS11325.1 cell division protein FtsQ [Sphingomonas jatrophae]
MTAKATIRRSNVARNRPRTVQRGRGRPAVKRAPSALARAVAAMPVPAAALKRAAGIGLWLLLFGGLIAGILAMKLPQMVGVELGEALGRAGFRVRTIEIRGIDAMDRGAVYAAAADQKSRAMPLVDLEEIRTRLMRYGWIADARVSRRLPDTLVVDIVERRPAAVWQHQRRLTLIDRDGRVIAPVALTELPSLPLVIGPGANLHVTGLNQLVATQPAIRPVLAGATWVGDRRWDLRFLSGETLALPEGQEASLRALAEFVRLDGKARLLGQGFVRFDMRVPDKFVVRVTREPGHRVADDAARPLVKPADSI